MQSTSSNLTKKNNKELWFKAKRYGWGWYPVNWKGWLVTLAYVALLLLSTPFVESHTFLWYCLLLLSTIALIAICYRYGEKPSWNWGSKPSDVEHN